MGTRGIDDAAEYRSTARNTKVAGRSGHDDFVLEATRGDDEQKAAHSEEGERIRPEMDDTGAAQNHAACDVDEIAGGNEIAERVEKLGHGLARENISGKKDAWQNGEKRELHGFGLGVCFAGDEDAEGERNENVGKREEA